MACGCPRTWPPPACSAPTTPGGIAAGAPLNTDDHNLLAARSARLGGRALFAKGLRRVLAPYPPLAPTAASLDPIYLVRRVAATFGPERAEAIARSLPDPVARETAQGFVQRARGELLRAARSFERALALDSKAAEARFGLLEARRFAVAQGDPALLALAQGLPPAAAAVVEGWRAEARSDDARIRRLDAELAKATPREAAFVPATLLRVGWRIRSGAPELAAEALELVDGVLAVGAGPAELLLRARAAAAAGRHDIALSTLEDVTAMLPRLPSSQPLARDGLGILAELTAPQLAERADDVRARLRLLLR